MSVKSISWAMEMEMLNKTYTYVKFPILHGKMTLIIVFFSLWYRVEMVLKEKRVYKDHQDHLWVCYLQYKCCTTIIWQWNIFSWKQSFKTKIKGDQCIPEILYAWNTAEFSVFFRDPLAMSSSRCPFSSLRSPSAPSTAVRCSLRLTLRLPTPRAQRSWPVMRAWRRSSARSIHCARRSRACASRWEHRKARPGPAWTSTLANQIWKTVQSSWLTCDWHIPWPMLSHFAI